MSLGLVRFIGDIHGDFPAIRKITETCKLSVQVGDYGIGFGKDPSFIDENQRFIRGNHDDYEKCKAYLAFIDDGTVYPTKYGPMMFIGGAWSIDKPWRTPGVDWWHTEEVTQEKAYKLLEQYKALKPAIMVTHDMPRDITMSVFGLTQERAFKNLTNMMLNDMWHEHKPKAWIHGHWHNDYQTAIEGCQFIGLGINSWVDIEM